MSYFDDLPPEVLQRAWEVMEKNRKEALSKKLGRPVLDWGGKRKGAGRPRQLIYRTKVELNLNAVQKKVLAEMGEGSIDKGIEKLINEAM
jgi:hypothetical protein